MEGNTIQTNEKAYSIYLSDDKMTVTLSFECEGSVDKDTILSDLVARNIVFGIDKNRIEEVIAEHELGIDYIIARGKKPQNGEDGRVEYFFKTSADFKPEVDETGNINFKSLNIVNNVEVGTKLARIIYPTNGVDGMNVFAKTVKCQRGKNPIVMFDDRSVERNEKNELISKLVGAVRLTKGKIIVENQFVVKGDVGPVTGNIVFNGSVTVTGNVLTDYEVRASGDVEVKGSVEGGSIYSKGNVIVHKGVIGMNKGRVEAEGFLHAKYIQSCEVDCKEDIVAESILYCNVKCRRSITVKGRKGVLNGGIYRASELVSAKQLGSHMCTKTVVEVGIDPALMERFKKAKSDIADFSSQIDKLELIIETLNKKKDELNPQKKVILENAINSRDKLEAELNEATYSLFECEELITSALGGSVQVSGVAYQGVKIQISECVYYVNDELKSSKFVKKKGDIVRVPL